MASAQVPNPLQSVIARTVGFAGGINLRDDIFLLEADELRKAENVLLDEKGAVQKRDGCTSMGTFGIAGDTIISQATFYRGTTAPQVVIHTSAGKMYYTNDPTVNPIVWTLIASGLSTTAPMSFETFNGKLYFSNGVDAYASWDGTTYTTYASAPKGKYLRLWKDTMWVAGVTGLDDRVYSSNAGDAETFGVSAWVDITKGDGDAITGLGTDGLFLAVFKLNRYMIIYDPALFSNRIVDFEKGCEGHFSILQFEGNLYFLSRRGFCAFDANGPAAFVSQKMDPLFDPNILNFDALDKAWAYTEGTRIGWALPEVGSSVPTVQVEFYPRISARAKDWRYYSPFVFHRMPATTFTRYRWGTVEYLFGGKSGANTYLKMFSGAGDDDGVAFYGYMETGAFDFGQPQRTKYIRRIRVLGRGNPILQLKKNFQTAIYKTNTVDLASGTDLWSTADTWGVGTWGPDSLLREALVNPDAYGRFIQLVFTDAEITPGTRLVEVGSQEYSIAAGEWGVYGVVLEADLMGIRD